MKTHHALIPIFAVLVAAGCASSNSASTASPVPREDSIPLAIRWFRRSAEQRASYREIFRAAGERAAELSRGLAPQTWAIITDADETVLDNSAFEEERAVQHVPYSEEKWSVFVRREVSTATPGAVEFYNRVHQLGGRFVVVTNRAADLCDVTRDNLTKVGLAPDVLLCHPPKPASGDKNPRFQAVQQGTAAAGVPALRVIEWLGDNIQDFPNLTQTLRTQPDSAFTHFGYDYFVLPDPMYGSWEKNPG